MLEPTELPPPQPGLLPRLRWHLDRTQRAHPALGFLLAVVKKFGEDRAGNLAALVAYFGLLSLFPLMVVFTSVLGFVVTDPEDQRRFSDAAADQIPVVGSTIQPGTLQVFDLAANTKTTMSDGVYPLGVAINGSYVVWVENLGPQVSPIFGEDADVEFHSFPDTELKGYSFSKKQKYRMIDFRGQQAYPSLSDSGLLAWQETGNGNSDIYATRLSGQ